MPGTMGNAGNMTANQTGIASGPEAAPFCGEDTEEAGRDPSSKPSPGSVTLKLTKDDNPQRPEESAG